MADGGQPRREAELVEPVEVADLDRQEPLDGRRVRPEVRPVDPHPDHRGPGVDPVGASRPRGRTSGRRGDVRDPRPDDVAQDRRDAVRRGPSRTAAAASGRCTRGRATTGASPAQATPQRVRANSRSSRSQMRVRGVAAGRARGTRAAAPGRWWSGATRSPRRPTATVAISRRPRRVRRGGRRGAAGRDAGSGRPAGARRRGGGAEPGLERGADDALLGDDRR